MTAITNDPATDVSGRFGPAIAGLLPRHLDRLSWNAEQLAAHQREHTGIDVAVIAEGALDHEALAASLERVLRGAGVPGPRVDLSEVTAIPCLPQSGKTRRFISR